MSVPASFERLILRAVLRNVNPMVIRLVAVPDFLDLADFDNTWRLEIRLEKKLPIEQNGRYPRCIGGSGAAVPEDCGGTTAFECFRDLFTPDYILWRLAEMLDEGWKPDHVKELAGLRPWMNRVCIVAAKSTGICSGICGRESSHPGGD